MFLQLSRMQQIVVVACIALLLGLFVLAASYQPPLDFQVTEIALDQPTLRLPRPASCAESTMVLKVHVMRRHSQYISRRDEAIRFTGKPVGGTDAEGVTFTESVSFSGNSISNEASSSSFKDLPPAFLTGRPSEWTATVIHRADVNPANDTLAGVILNPCP